MRRSMISAVLGLMLVLVSAAPALADPAGGNLLTVDCAGGTFEVIGVPGQGSWTPAHAVGGNDVFQPVGFGDYWYEVYDASDGSLIDAGVEEGTDIKKGNRTGQDMIECSFSAEFAGYDEYLGMEVFGSYGGTVYIKSKAS